MNIEINLHMRVEIKNPKPTQKKENMTCWKFFISLVSINFYFHFFCVNKWKFHINKCTYLLYRLEEILKIFHENVEINVPTEEVRISK